MPTNKRRIWVTFEPGVYKEIAQYAKEAGVKPTQYVNMAAILGCRMLARIASPEKFLTPEMLEAAMRLEKEDTNK